MENPSCNVLAKRASDPAKRRPLVVTCDYKNDRSAYFNEYPFPLPLDLMAACAAARRAMGTL